MIMKRSSVKLMNIDYVVFTVHCITITMSMTSYIAGRQRIRCDSLNLINNNSMVYDEHIQNAMDFYDVDIIAAVLTMRRNYIQFLVYVAS